MLSDDDRLDRANQLFSDALELPSGERDSFVRRECGEDGGLCESVLKLLTRFESLGNFLETPAGGRAEVTPGDLLDGHFRILELLGRGGMGEVYRADDLHLGETVALKMVRAEWRTEPDMLARFRDEVRLAHRISHPNVCRVYGFHTCTFNGAELAFFEMEFLDGESLAKAIAARGRFEAAAILRLAAGIAAGLDAAHGEGVIHRDLKPGNIFLTRDRQGGDRPVIADFGLARSVEAGDGTQTQSGLLAGSPDYMAPEQYLGEELTTAVDIFALGLIVYEMAAGRRPYPSESLVRAAVRRVMEPAPPLSRVAPDVPRHWDRVLERALARNPRRRYPTAAALVEELAKRPSGIAVARSVVRVPVVSRRAWLAASGAGVAAMSSFYGVWRLYQRRLPNAPLIMMTPLKSASPANAAALDLQLEKGLLQSAFVRVLDSGKVREAWRRMGRNAPLPAELAPKDAREIALREGAQFVFFGGLAKVADDWEVRVRLELLGGSPDYPRDKFPASFTAESEQALLGAAAKAAQWIRRTAGEAADAISEKSRTPEEITTNNWQALREFTAARATWRARPVSKEWSPDQRAATEDHLRNALRLDPEFALAAATLADIQVASRETDQGLLNYQLAARIMEKRNLSDRESLLIRGLFALDIGQYGEAQTLFSRYASEYPREGLPLFYEARATECQGNLSAALRLLDEAIRKEPESYSFLITRGVRYLILGQLIDAKKDCDRAAKLDPTGWTEQLRGALAFARGDMVGLEACLDRMRAVGSVENRSRAHALQACLCAERGKWPEAEAILTQGIRFDTENLQPQESLLIKQKLLALGYVELGRAAEAVAICRQILSTKPGLRFVLETGAILAQAGDMAGARQCIPAGLPGMPPERVPKTVSGGAQINLIEWPYYWRRILRLWAEMAISAGRPKTALDLMQAAPAAESIQEWPDTLIRASIASGEQETARAQLRRLFGNPASFWLEAEKSHPMFMRRAIAQAKQLSGAGDWARLQQFLN